MHLTENRQFENTLHHKDVSLTYADLLTSFDEMDKIFDPCKGKIGCLFIGARNDLHSVQIIYYLMTRKINFILQNASKPDVPPFCDYILQMNDDSDISHKSSASLKIHSNKECSGKIQIPQDSGAIIFTSSGSTGQAKYVYHDPDRLIKNAQNIIQQFTIKPGTRILIPVPISHMFGFGVGLLPALLSSASIMLIEANNVVKFIDALRKFTPDICLVTSSFCKMLVSLNRRISNKSVFITAGDSTSSQLFYSFESMFGTLFNLYGSTELGAVATTGLEDSAEERAKGTLKCLPNVNIKIESNDSDRIYCHHKFGFQSYITPQGEIVTRQDHEGFWFNTNDVGQYFGSDRFVVKGRADHAVNRFGFLVPFQTIEVALLDTFSDYSQIVVTTVAQESVSGQRVIAFFEGNDRVRFDRDEIVRISASKLPRHLRPDEFIILKTIPKLTSGKPDRQSLRKNYLQVEIKQ